MTTVLLASLIGFPILGFALLVAIRRSARFRTLAPAIFLSGITASMLAAWYGFTRSTMPIGPYETGGGFPWLDLVKSMLAFVLVGFGIGALLASGVAIPVTLLTGLAKRRTHPPRQEEPPPPFPPGNRPA